MALDLKQRDRSRAWKDAKNRALARGQSLWHSTPRAERAVAVALCVVPALVLALAFSRGAIGAQPTDGDPFRASARMQKLLAQPARTADLDVPQSAPAALPQTSPAPPLLHLRGRLQMNEGPLVVLLEIEGVPGLQRLVVGESLAVRSGGVERSLRLVDNGTRDPWVSMDGGAPVPLR